MFRYLAIVLAAAVAFVFIPSGGPAPLILDSSPAVVATAMQNAGHGSLSAGRQFVAFDPAGDGRVIEVLGDPATATRVAVIVPGSDTTLETYDGGLGLKARSLYAAVLAKDPSAAVAVVAWLGYDPPEGLGLAAVRSNRAAAGAVELQRFVSTISAEVVLIGHSYGTVVVSLALADAGSHVTDAVFLASPGIPVAPPSGLRAWSATAPSDWINRVPKVQLAGLGHGSAPDFTPLPVSQVMGHDGYFSAPSTLEAMAEVVLPG